MTGLLSVLSIISKLHDSETVNLKALFAQRFNVEITDHDLINKFVLHRFNQYVALNTKDYRLWDCIQIDFEKFEVRHLDKLDSVT